jgi:replicative DNA helicase
MNVIRTEQETLGEMLLSKAAITDVVKVCQTQTDDFHHPAHRIIFDCILDLYGRGQPADPVTVTMELARRGDLFSVGGASYLHALISIAPPRGGLDLCQQSSNKPQ